MALIPFLALAFLAGLMLVVGLGVAAAVVVVVLLVKYRGLRRIVIPASLVIAAVMAGKAWLVHHWSQAALKLAPLAV
jgi:hypothetical protein